MASARRRVGLAASILGTVDLTSGQWMSVIDCTPVLVALVVEVYKVFRRSARQGARPRPRRQAVVPERVGAPDRLPKKVRAKKRT